MPDDDQPTRDELIEARERLKDQLGQASSPMLGRDVDRRMVEKLSRMIDEINECLGEPAADA